MGSVLSSDILERQFGPTEVEVLSQDAGTRIICTRVLATSQVLELSSVAFVQSGVDKFSGPHQAITEGLSMGKAFRADGIEFLREERAAYNYALLENFDKLFGSREPATVVSVSILVGPDKTPYAEILETYSPAIRWPAQAGEPSPKQLAAIRSLDEFLAGLAGQKV